MATTVFDRTSRPRGSKLDDQPSSSPEDAMDKPPAASPSTEEDKPHESIFGEWSPETAGTARLKVLLYGASGSGKTYMAGTFPHPLFLDLEGGMRTVLQAGRSILRYPSDPKKTVTSLNQVRSFYKALRDGTVEKSSLTVETIVIDSLNELQLLAMKDILSKYDANRQYDDQPTMQDYGKLARDMMTIVRMFIQLPYHVVFTAIASEKEFPEDQTSPMFTGKKTGPDVQRMMDIIGYCHTALDKDGKILHRVGFENSPGYVAKDRTGRLGAVLPNTYAAMAERLN